MAFLTGYTKVCSSAAGIHPPRCLMVNQRTSFFFFFVIFANLTGKIGFYQGFNSLQIKMDISAQKVVPVFTQFTALAISGCITCYFERKSCPHPISSEHLAPCYPVFMEDSKLSSLCGSKQVHPS